MRAQSGGMKHTGGVQCDFQAEPVFSHGVSVQSKTACLLFVSSELEIRKKKLSGLYLGWKTAIGAQNRSVKKRNL